MPVLKKNKMIKLVLRIIVIGFLSFSIGILWNLLYPQGIHPRELEALFCRIKSSDFQTVSVDSAIFMMFEEEVLFVDIRSSEDYRIDHIPQAISMPFRQYVRNPSLIKTFLDGRPLVLYHFNPDCREVLYVGKLMKEQGVYDMMLLKEGFAGWIEAGMPVERPEDL